MGFGGLSWVWVGFSASLLVDVGPEANGGERLRAAWSRTRRASLPRSAGRKLFGAGFYRGILGIRRYGGANSGILPRDSPGFLLRILVDSSRVVGFLGFADTTTTTPPTTKPTELRIYFPLAHCKRTYKKRLLLRSCAPACCVLVVLLPYCPTSYFLTARYHFLSVPNCRTGEEAAWSWCSPTSCPSRACT